MILNISLQSTTEKYLHTLLVLASDNHIGGKYIAHIHFGSCFELPYLIAKDLF
jgi:hypothetical protein